MERVHYLMQVNQQTYLAEFPQIDSGLAVLVFKQGDDPIDAINKMMSFLSTVVTSRFPTTNNQLRNSSNPRQQATIHDGRTLELQKVIQVTYKVITNNESLISNDLMRMIQTGDDFSIAQGILMSSFILVTDQCSHSRLPQSKNTNNDMLNQTELERHKEQTYKQLYDLIKPSRVRAKEHVKSLVNQLNQKSVEITDLNALTQEKVFRPNNINNDIEKEIQGKDIDDQCSPKCQMLPQLLQGSAILRENIETRDTCPDIHKPSEKLVVVTPINKKKTVSRSQVIQIVLWYLDSGCSKHMTGDRSQLTNFVHKFLGTVKFGNDQIAKIIGYDLEVAFRKHTCFIRNLEGVDLLLGSRETNLYTLSFKDMMASSPTCLLSKASKTKSWLWHRRLSHLNFGAINHLAKNGLSTSLGPELHSMTPTTSSSGLVPNPIPQQPCNPPNRDYWDRLFQPMSDAYFNPPTIDVSPVPVAVEPRVVDIADSHVSTSIDKDAPSTSIPSTQEQEHSLIISQGFEESPKPPQFHDNPLHESLHEDSTSQG
ncbi:integrase, catalytic region, zinc finger, CCHC-type containing protein [Tanacetum coccineum]